MTGIVGRGRWVWRVAVVIALMVTPCAVARPDLGRAIAVLGTATVVLGGVAALRRHRWTGVLSTALPPGEREAWRAEVASVLHATADRRELRRQRRSFVLSFPACVVAGWRSALATGRTR